MIDIHLNKNDEIPQDINIFFPGYMLEHERRKIIKKIDKLAQHDNFTDFYFFAYRKINMLGVVRFKRKNIDLLSKHLNIHIIDIMTHLEASLN